MQIQVLGRLRLVQAGTEVDLGSRKQRALLAALALTPNRVVSPDVLAELLWGEDPPPAVAASLHGYVAGLRRALEPDRGARGRSTVLLTVQGGYELRVDVDELDSTAFATAVESAHRRLGGGELLEAPPGLHPQLLAALADEIGTTLSLWRGPPFPELEDHPAARAEQGRLEDLRLLALQDRARVQLALGRHAVVAAELAPLTRQYPLREDLWGLRALALARSGRQAEALESLAEARSVLADELGIDPGPPLRQLQAAILQQAPEVLPIPAGATAAAALPLPTAPRPDRATSDDSSPPPAVPALTAAGPPLVGRAAPLAALTGLLQAASTGVPQWAVLIGEPGIGKTRLSQEVAARAVGQGFTVLVGRCSQDEGAPPLWPWVRVLRSVAESWPDVRTPDLEVPRPDGPLHYGEGSEVRFRTFDAVSELLTGVAADHPLLLLFDDLHWADASSLRLLRHLVDTVDAGRLLVLLTRRDRPAPEGPLAHLGESLVRRGALRLELSGLSAEDVTELAGSAIEGSLGPREAAALRERTGGNPFFLVETLRLGEGRPQGPSPDVVAPAVGDVVAARVGTLPPATQDQLCLAAVLGRRIDPQLLTELHGGAEDVVDRLEPALTAGLVIDTADGDLQFSHALVRDAVYRSLSPRLRHRRHAEVAQLLESRGDARSRSAEIARHWLRAGAGHASRAWRAAAAAAADASRLQAHEEAADLLAEALRSQAVDGTADARSRYDLLMARAQACRLSADSDGQRAATATAIELARADGDDERLAAAAVTSSQGALWSNRPRGELDPATIEALELAIRRLPGGDTSLRCHVHLAMSRELYWAPHPQQREAHADVGLAMARRLDDPQLRAWACHTSFVAAIRPATMAARIELAAEAIACSRQAGDREGEVVGLFFQALAVGEAGQLIERREAVLAAMTTAGQHRLRYLQVMLGAYEVPWLSLEGRFAEAAELYDQTTRWAEHTSFPFRDEALAGARLCVELWRGRGAGLLPQLAGLARESPADLSSALLLLQLRTGQPADVAAQLDRQPPALTDDTFDASLVLSLCAEAALVLERPQLAAQVYPLIAPWRGRFVSAGTGTPLGPAECFLALAAAAVGERELAAEHADRALEVCAANGLGPVSDWLTGHRLRAGF